MLLFNIYNTNNNNMYTRIYIKGFFIYLIYYSYFKHETYSVQYIAERDISKH